VSEEGQEFKNFSKNAVFIISSGKNQISPLLAPRRKTFEKSTSAPPGKILSDDHAQACKMTPFL